MANKKPVRGVSGRVVTSKNAIRRAESSRRAASRPGRPQAHITHPQLRDYEFLRAKYDDSNMTIAQIAELIGVSKETTRKAMLTAGIKLREAGTYKTGEHKRRKRSPRSKPVLTDEQRQLDLACPACEERQWYTPLKSDTWLCNVCNVWWDITCEDGVLIAEEAQTPE